MNVVVYGLLITLKALIKSILSAIAIILAHLPPPAASFHRCRALLMSFLVPLPVAYMRPRLNCAMVWFLEAG